MPRAFRTVTVAPYLPARLEPLRGLAYDLSWAFRPDCIELFRRMDRALWDRTDHNPVAQLAEMPQERLEALSEDESFLEHLSRVVAETHAYLLETTWYDRHCVEGQGQTIGYFSFEFGLSECLRIYSGGLGVLAGDHLKSASDLGVPIAGVGLLYQEGYFRQYLNADGWQQEEYPDNDFYSLPVQPVLTPTGDQARIHVRCSGRDVAAHLWKVMVGRVSLYLLDTNVPENDPLDREITARLYGGDRDMRIRQEIVLGIGGVRALQAAGVKPAVFHMNEGHAAFLGLERIRQAIEAEQVSFLEAREALSVSHVFTTHTPVPAGHDRFETELMDRHFGEMWPQLGLSRDQFLALGRQNPLDPSETFNMTYLAVRMSAWRNGVAALHGEVSRRTLSGLWPGVPESEVPVTSVTNGVHTGSWLSHDMGSLFDRYLGTRWRQRSGDPTIWEGMDEIPDTEIWRTHERRRERLVAYARKRLQEQLVKRGASPMEVAHAEEALDPEALTLGFARRFATYKRATLLLRDPDRLRRILCDRQRPAQIIVAGKAHPQDRPGKEMIREIIHFARHPELRNRIAFIEDYDMSIARYMVQGVDVWLNTPRRPNEASGTSGMKAAANGALNLSVLDGWWCEGYEPETGWAIGRGEEYEDLEYQDEVEAHAVFDILEKEIVPTFYDRGPDGLPRRWISKMKHAIRRLAPQFSSNRMVQEYAERFYLPAMQRLTALRADGWAQARKVAAWRERVRGSWGAVRILSVDDDHEPGCEVGDKVTVTAVVDLGDLLTADVRVEMYHGRVDPYGGIAEGRVMRMHPVKDEKAQAKEFQATLQWKAAGQRGYTIRVTPEHEHLVNPLDMGLVTWAG